VAPAEVISKLVQLKQGADLHTSTFNQMVAYEVARDNFLDDHIKTIRRVYSERRDVMLQALKENFPPEVTWTYPHGGLFLWVTLPEGTNCNVMLKSAVQENVAFVPGDCFYPREGDGLNNMRLNFSNATPEQIREGIRRLAIVARTHIDQYAPVTVMA
jgi:2-aminoadipate transaminase